MKWKQKRCRYCRRLFRPDPRVGSRQVACKRTECQRQRHRDADRRWHARNPDYDTDRRLVALAERLKSSGTPEEEMRREPEPVRRLPVDAGQEAFGLDGLAYLVLLARILARHSQDERPAQRSRIAGKPRGSLLGVSQDEIARQPAINSGESSKLVSPVPQDEIAPAEPP